ncbi:MAG: hypothetical protein GX591_08450 [Planctomycetes bacterium]|nr:hypothetical protein [Planctomycetota bacterium]
MPSSHTHPTYRRRGSTLLLTMIFLALFTTLALSFTAATDMNFRQANSYRSAAEAQLAAESGAEFVLAALQRMIIPVEQAEADLLGSVHHYLAADLNGTATLGGEAVTYDGTVIRLPTVTLGSQGRAFRAEIDADAMGQLRLTVYGTARHAQRAVRMLLDAENTTTPVFDFGIASKGRIIIGGDGSVLGANLRSEAAVLSATYSNPEAVYISGSCTVDGDIYTANPDSYVTIKGKPTVAGTSSPSQMEDHIHVGMGEPVFPEVDTAPFEALATNTLDTATTNIDGDLVLENVRIPAGTNPTFSGNVIIRGVLFIEQPNNVRFSGNADIIGTIATEDPGDWAFQQNAIAFSGNVDSYGVEALPDEPQFQTLRTLPGSMLLAPGFAVTMTGSSSTINGAIAADKFTISGNAGGRVYGPIIVYGDTELEILGSARIEIDRSSDCGVPSGFKLPVKLVAVQGTYVEPS